MVKIIFKLYDGTIVSKRYEKHIPRTGDLIEYSHIMYEVMEVIWSYAVGTTVTLHIRKVDGDDEVNL